MDSRLDTWVILRLLRGRIHSGQNTQADFGVHVRVSCAVETRNSDRTAKLGLMCFEHQAAALIFNLARTQREGTTYSSYFLWSHSP